MGAHPIQTRWPLLVLLALNACKPIDSWVCRHYGQNSKSHFLEAANGPEAVQSSETTTNRPVVTGVTLKVAFDENWGVAEMANNAEIVRFTCSESLDMVHRLRRDSDAVLVGRGTVERDDCSLTVRRGVTPAKQPLRVILDPRLCLVLDAINDGTKYQVLTDGLPTVIYHCLSDVLVESLGLMESVTLVCLDSSEPTEGNRPGRYFSPAAVVDHLKANFDVKHLMVEGGPHTALNFLQADLIDRAVMVRAPIAFQEPFPSGMTANSLKDAGLETVGTSASGVDTIDCWARPGDAWPTDPVGDWP